MQVLTFLTALTEIFLLRMIKHKIKNVQLKWFMVCLHYGENRVKLVWV
jgi:hypothetical protein